MVSSVLLGVYPIPQHTSNEYTVFIGYSVFIGCVLGYTPNNTLDTITNYPNTHPMNTLYSLDVCWGIPNMLYYS